MISSSSNKSKKFRPFNQIQDNETIRVNSTNEQQNPQLQSNYQVAKSNIELKMDQKNTSQINSEQQNLETEKSVYSFRPIQKNTRKIQQKQNSENKLPKLDINEQAQKTSEKYQNNSEKIQQYKKENQQNNSHETSTYGNQIIKIIEQYFFKWAQKLKQILQLFRQEIIDRANSFEKVHFEDMISDLNKINKVTNQLNEQAEILISVYNKLETQKILDQTKKQNKIACSLYLCLELVSSIQNSILKDLEQDYQEDKISQKNSVIYQYNSSNNSTNNISNSNLLNISSGVLYLDSKLTEKFLSEIHENCIEYQNKYKEIWDQVIQIRKEINMQTDLFEDRNLIAKEIQYIQDLIHLGENINQIDNNPLKTEEPPNIVIQDEDQRQQSIEQHQKNFNKQLQVNIDLPFNKSNVIITQSDNIIAEYYIQQQAEDLSQYQAKEIPFQPDSYLFQPITININQVKDYENQINAEYSTQRSKRSQGVTPRGQTSPNNQLLKNQQQKNKGFKNHHEVQNINKNDAKNNKNKNNHANTNHNYIDEEEEDDQDESKIFASFEDFERINVEREILVSAINPVIQFDSVPVTLYEHEQWKMYSKFDIGMILGHEIRIIDPRNKDVVGVVNSNQNEWNGIVFEDFSSIVMQEMTIINYQQYSNEPIEDLNQYQFWFIIDCRQEIGNMAIKNYKIFLQGLDVNNEFVSYNVNNF
ncbi:hypothetical protein PPERSA_11745 [Pseudocohnilembus persalinus]|uniref:Uncharacterized protein n=1 Tax=Pseudocohnilembus persalinus TaxID=266149 RepID=A0A0V0QGF1_PSEPJ|nr:hypothetical protein PPERSA_11745 [Pseudocohnilembus persalinus]|eukprot:KRX01298.1 hypothetical protein PPERSA_11745 [Pseudocohnilembus persalinus]